MTNRFPENATEGDGRSHGDRSRRQGCEDREKRERLSHLIHAEHAGGFLIFLFSLFLIIKHIINQTTCENVFKKFKLYCF